MHIDQNMALVSGFNKPILHGLCTLGYSVRIVLGACANYDFNLFKAVKVSKCSSMLNFTFCMIKIFAFYFAVYFYFILRRNAMYF